MIRKEKGFRQKKIKRGVNMPDRNGKGPRKRSRYPSKPKGGRRQGNC